MLYLKIGGAFLLVVGGILAGSYRASKLKDRITFYEQYIRFLTQASSLIGYTAANVTTLFESIQGVPVIEPLLKTTMTHLSMGEDFPTAWQFAVQRFVTNQTDRRLLNYFGDTFGTENCAGELAKLSLHRETAARLQADLRQDYQTKHKLYRTLGLFGGTLLAILLV